MSIFSRDTILLLLVILLTICTLTVIFLRRFSRRSNDSVAIPPAFIVRTIASFQPLIPPVSEIKRVIPSKFPPIEIVTMDAPYPGTILFSNATNPFRKDLEGTKS